MHIGHTKQVSMQHSQGYTANDKQESNTLHG